MTQKEVLADGLLLLTALIWGSAFAVVKNTLDSFAPGAIIAMRYVIGAAVTAVLFKKHLKGIQKADVIRGALVDAQTICIFCLTLVIGSFTDLSPVILVVCAGVAGVVIQKARHVI